MDYLHSIKMIIRFCWEKAHTNYIYIDFVVHRDEKLIFCARQLFRQTLWLGFQQLLKPGIALERNQNLAAAISPPPLCHRQEISDKEISDIY